MAVCDNMGRILLPFVLVYSFHLASSATLFSVGKEFKYHYETLVTAGSEEPVSHASAYKLKGSLVVSADSSTTLQVKLEDLTVGLYNGPWSYFPIPEMKYFTSPDLAPLSQSFQITLENGKAKSILLDDQEPEWASNMKRGLATYLQMDLDGVNFNELKVLNRKELTTVGECITKYEILPSSTTLNRLTRVNKFRNHADCPDIPTRTRYATHIFYPCGDKDTRDIMNSTAYSTYEMEVSKDGQPLLKQLTLFSSVLYWPFTSSGPYQFSWLNMTLSLDSVSRLENKAFPPPENAETFEDLSYVFEQSDPTFDAEDENTELTNEVLFFHHIAVDGEVETYRQTVELLKGVIKETAESLVDTQTFFENMKRFHQNSPFSFIPLVGSLDYENLKQMFSDYSVASASGGSKLTELQLFLDGLILAGTTPATLVIRDILQTSSDPGILTRLAPSLPHFIRNPTEALGKEMDALLTLATKESINPSIRQTITFSLASLIGRCCRKTNCTTSGLLDKYINYFETKLSTATGFEERTVALLGLRNLRMGKALDKVLDIAAGKLIYEPPLRIQAVWSLRNLVYQDRERVLLNLLPVFYNRSESCELRTTVFAFLMSVTPDEKLLHDIAYFMWTETCPMVSNMVRSHLINAMNTKSPCGNQLKSYARTILRYLPPGKVDPLQSSNYQLDYYDRNSGFGHQIYATVQKSGKTALPISIYIGLNNYIGGYGSSYFGIFIRMEGVEKAIANKLAAVRSTDVSKIKEILSKIGVTSRPSSPMYLELTVVYHDYTLLHYAVDERTLSNLPAYLKSLGSLTDKLTTNWERSVMLGGIFQEFPLEIGTPVSILAGVTGIGSIVQNTTTDNLPPGFSQETKLKLQFNLFGMSRISNHAPSLGTMHSMTTYRGLRLVVPRHFGIGGDMRGSAINFFGTPPSESDPVVAMAHGTGITSLNYDSPNRVKDNLALELLRKSCGHCEQDAIVSRGPHFRKSRVLPLKFPLPLQGTVSEVKYFDCERDHSRAAVLKKLSNFFREENQNSGIYDSPLAKLFLSLTHAQDYIFIAPHAETCGIYARICQSETADTTLERVEGQFKGGVTFRDSNGQENFTAFLTYNLDLKFGGVKPGVIHLKYNLEIKERSVETHTLTQKLQVNDKISGQNGVICIKVDASANRLPKDLLSYEGVNEPTAEQRTKVSMGRVLQEESTDDTPPCLDNYASFEIISLATRSPEQKAEAASDIYPYNVCKAEKGSRDYPGSFVPPSAACHAAVTEQTNLRLLNVTIKYKIVEELETRWRQRVNLISGLLYPYLSSLPEASHFSHVGHSHGAGSLESGKKYFQGEIDLDMNIKKDSPSVDIHFHDFTQNKEEHYHDIDLTLVPSFVRPQPLSSRMSPLWEIGFKTGAVSHCSVTPASVNTLDGLMYSAPLSDCWTLISGDCGVNAQFAILGKKISAEKIGIFVHFGEHTVELGGDLNPIIDGKQVTLEDKTIFVSENATPLPFDVFKNGDEGYIISRTLGIYVRYTGHFVTVTLGSRYRAVQCGLCGHWDSSFYNDLIGPDSSCPALLQPAEMTKAFVVNEGSCAKLGDQCPTTPS